MRPDGPPTVNPPGSEPNSGGSSGDADRQQHLDRFHAGTLATKTQAIHRSVCPGPDVVLAQPVMFEMLRYASDEEAPQLEEQFRLLPLLLTPPDLWSQAAELGRSCRRSGINAGAIDLLISSVAIHHGAELITFDADFQRVASVSAL